MVALGFPTVLLSSIPRTAIGGLQQRLASAQTEIATQRKADIGLHLGAATARFVDLNWQLAELDGQKLRISAARNRAEATQSTLESIRSLTGDFLETLAGARGAALGQDIARQAASGSIASLYNLLNAEFGGVKLFGGLNSQTNPMPDYEGGSGQQAVRDAFAANFGFAPSDPSAASITPDRMLDFVNGAFARLFDEANWQTLWTEAAPKNATVMLSNGQQVEASSSATAGFAVSLTQAFSMMLELSQGPLRQDAFAALVDTALSRISGAQQELIAEQSRMGLAQERLTAAEAERDTKSVTAKKAIEMMQGVDTYALAMKVNTLTTQLEASYALTGRLSRLSLLAYI